MPTCEMLPQSFTGTIWAQLIRRADIPLRNLGWFKRCCCGCQLSLGNSLALKSILLVPALVYDASNAGNGRPGSLICKTPFTLSIRRWAEHHELIVQSYVVIRRLVFLLENFYFASQPSRQREF